jgi:hypothetical protein
MQHLGQFTTSVFLFVFLEDRETSKAASIILTSLICFSFECGIIGFAE